ncbi:endonuclease NucS domain-containing protein [Caldalkalibacillus salinus]|uniref:endonuclease NucS domain-containing protein n=1 Tax=Caldalkalibacillus salinus TaxID=2803787 RepID=UPI001924D0AC|nr:endonuclease NucS domain-containing protein [Caldalkalibacillus salinus]
MSKYIFESKRLLEEFIIECPDFIEEGLEVEERHKEVDSDIIDLVARDSEGTLTLIKLHVSKEDRDIVWKSAFYQSEFEEDTRMIIVNYDYDSSIHKALQHVKNVDTKYHFIDNRGLLTIDEFTEGTVVKKVPVFDEEDTKDTKSSKNKFSDDFLKKNPKAEKLVKEEQSKEAAPTKDEHTEKEAKASEEEAQEVPNKSNNDFRKSFLKKNDDVKKDDVSDESTNKNVASTHNEKKEAEGAEKTPQQAEDTNKKSNNDFRKNFMKNNSGAKSSDQASQQEPSQEKKKDIPDYYQKSMYTKQDSSNQQKPKNNTQSEIDQYLKNNSYKKENQSQNQGEKTSKGNPFRDKISNES